MASFSNQQENCKICGGNYRDPRILQCWDYFCKDCIGNIIQDESVTCPKCDHVTAVHGRDGLDKLVPYNDCNVFTQKVNVVLGKPVKERQKKFCQECKEKATYATKACLICWVNLCDTCAAKHDKVEKTLKHKIHPISPHMFCEKHGEKGIQSFCMSCKILCCPHCSMNDHRQHDIEAIEAAGDKFRQRIQQILNNMKSAKAEHRVSTSVTSLLEKAKYLQADFKKTITDTKQQLMSLLEKMKKVEVEITEKLNENVKTLEDMATNMKDYMGSKDKLECHLTYLIENASYPEVVGSENDLPKYEISSFEKVIHKEIFEFPDFATQFRDIKIQLDKCQKDLDIGFTKHKVEGCSDKPLTNLNKTNGFTIGNNVYGLAIDSYRERLVVRRQGTTAPITVYDFQGQQLQVLGKDVEEIALSNCQGIAIDTKRDLYILPMTNGSLLTMDMNGIVMDTIKVIDKPLRGVTYCQTDFYVTSSDTTTQVYLIDPNTKQKVASFSPNTTFSNPKNVRSCQFTSGGVTKPVIVVSNCSNHCIKVLDMSGHLLHTYGKEGKSGQGDGELYHPWGVCTDPGGRIIVGDYYNYRVVSFWSEGDKDKFETLVSKDILSGYSNPIVACDPVTRRMFVAASNKPDILVFQG